MHDYMTFCIFQLQKCCQGKKAARMSSVPSHLPTRWVQTPTHHSRSLLVPKDASPAKPTKSLWPKTLRTMKSSMWTTLYPHQPHKIKWQSVKLGNPCLPSRGPLVTLPQTRVNQQKVRHLLNRSSSFKATVT